MARLEQEKLFWRVHLQLAVVPTARASVRLALYHKTPSHTLLISVLHAERRGLSF